MLTNLIKIKQLANQVQRQSQSTDSGSQCCPGASHLNRCDSLSVETGLPNKPTSYGF